MRSAGNGRSFKKSRRSERDENAKARRILAEPLSRDIALTYQNHRASLDFARIEAVLGTSTGTVMDAVELGRLEASLSETFVPFAVRGIEAGAELGAKFSGTEEFFLRKGTIEAAASRYAASEAAAQLAGINATTRNAVEQAVKSVMGGNATPSFAAEQIGNAVGLTPSQELSLRKFEQSRVEALIPGNPDAIYCYRHKFPGSPRCTPIDTPHVRRAIADDVERKRRQMLLDRGNVIAESEMQTSIIRGEQIYIEEIIAQNDELSTNHAVKQWFTVLDERVCPRCEPIHGQIRPLSGYFSNGAESKDAPPLHARCRCYLLYAFRPLSEGEG